MEDPWNEPQKGRSPDLVEQVEASGGIESLPSRAERYGKAKSIALDAIVWRVFAISALLHRRSGQAARCELLHEASALPSVCHQAGL
jgi:hypothetical protein